MAKIRREFKNVVYNYTDAEVKVREATSNDPWGPSGSLLAELAEYTFHIQAYSLVMGMLWKRLNDNGKNWRHVYKSIVVLDYLVKSGSQRVVQQCKDNMFSIETLKDFQYIDKEGKDQGTLIREKAKKLSALLKDEQKLEDERVKASKTKGRTSATVGSGSNTERSVRASSTPDRQSSDTLASPGSRFEPDINQSRPSAKDEEDLQLQLALRMSKEQADKDEELKKQEDESMKLALELSKKENGEGNQLEGNEEEDTADDDLLGLGDPWGKPPSYDTVTTPPSSDDPWVPPVTINKGPSADPFAVNDPFSSVPVTVDPWKPAPLSPPATSSPSFGDTFASSSTDPWSSMNSAATTINSTTLGFTTGPADTLPPLDVGLVPTSGPYDFSAFNAPLDGTLETGDEKKNPKVEESFLGSNAALVNLDSLITPLPPPTSIVNPFGTPAGGLTPPIAKSSNPFEPTKAPAPTLQQLQFGGGGFDPLPPPLLPTSETSDNANFNPFS